MMKIFSSDSMLESFDLILMYAIMNIIDIKLKGFEHNEYFIFYAALQD